MPLEIPVVWTDAHRLHDPDVGIWIGVQIPADELPKRAEAIRSALEEVGAPVVHAEPHSDDALHAVHEPELVSFLRAAWVAWEAAGLPEDPGQDQVVAYIFPHPAPPTSTRPTAGSRITSASRTNGAAARARART